MMKKTSLKSIATRLTRNELKSIKGGVGSTEPITGTDCPHTSWDACYYNTGGKSSYGYWDSQKQQLVCCG